jgi:electron transport complex protein RnfB
MNEEDVYRKLQRHLDRMPVPFPPTESGVEIRMLKRLFTPGEARVVLALSMIPEPAGVVHRRIRREMSLEKLREALENMAERGLIVRLSGAGEPRYGKSPLVVGFYEAQVNRLTEAFERDFVQYLDEAFGAALHSQRTQQMRTVPINQPIPLPDRPVARHDDISDYVRACEGPFAVMNCICQQGKDLVSEPCRVTGDREHCLTFGSAARMMVERGIGRSISRDEMLAFLQRADRDGLVLQPQNTQRPLFVCCCCGCCCGVLTTAKKLPRPAEFFGTNYHAEVASDACQECGTCATRCQMEAASDGDGPATVDLSRCIGCGLCVSTCPSGAMRLVAKPHEKVPPEDMAKLYMQMYRERYGPLGLVAAVGRKMLGLKT